MDNSDQQNSFQYYCDCVKKALAEYERIRNGNLNLGKGLSDTIHRKAKPFTEGHFNLAVIGKMSSGKSTFINALLGDANLLPTSFSQSTRKITTIEYGEESKVIITYGDYHTDERKICYGSDYSEFIRNAVALPEGMSSLPINLIDDLITLHNFNKEQILSDENIDKIKDEKSKKLICDYIDSHNKSNIPLQIDITLKDFPKEYIGWHIIDTPGLDAVGGIDLETKNYMLEKDEYGCPNVDAIVIISSGLQHTESGTKYNDFITNLINDLPEFKNKIFVVITQQAESTCRVHRKEITDKVNNLYVEKLGIPGSKPNQHIVFIDSICKLFLDFVNDNKIDDIGGLINNCDDDIFSSNITSKPELWKDDKTWTACTDILTFIDGYLGRKGREKNNNNFINVLKSLSCFDEVRNMLDSFAKNEKEAAFKNVMVDIEEDINLMLRSKKDEKTRLEGSFSKTSKELEKEKKDEIDKLNKAGSELKNIVNGISDKFNRNYIETRFLQYKNDMSKVKNSSDTIDQATKQYLGIIIRYKEERNKLFSDTSIYTKNEFKSKVEDVLIGNIDLEKLANNANNNEKNKDIVSTKPKKRIVKKEIDVPIKTFKGLCQRIWHWFGGKYGGYTKVTVNEEVTYIESITNLNQTKAKDEFCDNAYSEYLSNINDFKEDVIKKIEDFKNEAKIEIDDAVSASKQRIVDITKESQNSKNKETKINEINKQIVDMENVVAQLKSY